jgi:hypothetical protein
MDVKGGESTPSPGCGCAERRRESISGTEFGERRSTLLPRACSMCLASRSFFTHLPLHFRKAVV